ncbi:MAG: hypothetical protein GXP53_09370 [Deltaproteobacteria bacterium]|nr:hypothetical protein [Deltaproteobacteria bacterium]
MKKILTALIMLFLMSTAAYAAPKIVKFAGQWPFHPTKMVTVDSNSGIVFCGNGDTLEILDSGLNLISSMRVTEKGAITSLFYDPNRPGSHKEVFVTCRNDGLRVINVDDTVNPFKSGEYHPDGFGELNGVWVAGNLAYVAGHLAINNDGGGQDIFDMQIIDLAESPLSPVLSVHLVGAYGITYGIDVVVSGTGDYAYVSDLYTGIHVIDISDPADTAKQRDKRLMVLPGARDLFLSGNYLYTGSEGAGMMIVDVTDPLDPKAAGYDPEHPDLQTGVYAPDNPVRAVRVDGDKAYLAETAGGLEAIDISDKGAPVPYDPPVTYTYTGVRSLALYQGDNTIFITDYKLGLQKIDTSTPGALSRTASYDLPADAVAIDMLNGYAYVIDNTTGNDPSKEGLRILAVSVSNKVMTLGLTGFCATPGTATDVAATDGAAYVADGNQGLQIIDTTDKAAPQKAGAISTGGFAAGVVVIGNYAYVADRTAGLVIVDVSDKNKPVIKTTLSISGIPNRLAINKDHAFIASGDAGMVSVDISDPEAPKIDATLDTGGTANGIAVDAFRNLVFVANGDSGLVTVDNSDPTAPVFGNHLDLGADAKNAMLGGGGAFVYISAGEKGIIAVDTTNPSAPVIDTLWSYDTAGYCRDAAFYSSGDEIYILAADSGAGVTVINPTYDTSQVTSAPSTSNAGCFISVVR